MVLSQLQRSRQGKAGWGRGNGGGGSVPERFVILPVVNELFTLAFHQASIFLPDLSATCTTQTAGGLWMLCSVFVLSATLIAEEHLCTAYFISTATVIAEEHSCTVELSLIHI